MAKVEQEPLSAANYFRLKGQVQKTHERLIELVKTTKPNEIGDAPDETAYYALAYELLRVVQSNAFDRNMRPTGSKSAYARDKNQWIPKDAVDHETQFSNKQLINRLLADEEIYESIEDALRKYECPDDALEEVAKARNRLRSSSRARRWEIDSRNIDERDGKRFYVPSSFTKLGSPEAFRQAFMLLRWSIIAEYAFKTSINDSHNWYRAVIKHLRDAKNAKEMEVDTYLGYFLELISPIGAPSSYAAGPSQAQKLRREINRLWALEFMHADYAHLIVWGQEDDKCSLFLSDLIANRLGGFLLYIEHALGWFWENEDTWRKKVIKRNASTIPKEIDASIVPVQQPIKVEGKRYAFDYLWNIAIRKDLERVYPQSPDTFFRQLGRTE